MTNNRTPEEIEKYRTEWLKYLGWDHKELEKKQEEEEKKQEEEELSAYPRLVGELLYLRKEVKRLDEKISELEAALADAKIISIKKNQ